MAETAAESTERNVDKLASTTSSTPEPYYITNDHLGSTAVVTDLRACGRYVSIDRHTAAPVAAILPWALAKLWRSTGAIPLAGGFLRLESTWQVVSNGVPRLVTVIPLGGP